jgi:hypothetical protein
MSDLAHRLRESAKETFYDPLKSELNEAASHIEKLEEEISVLFAANVRLNSRADLDSDGYANRIEKLEAALRFIAGPSTVEFVDGTYEISETKMLSTYRRRAKRALEGNYDD